MGMGEKSWGVTNCGDFFGRVPGHDKCRHAHESFVHLCPRADVCHALAVCAAAGTSLPRREAANSFPTAYAAMVASL